MTRYVVGVDVGTGGSRAGVFELDGRQIAAASVDHELEHLGPGWVEQHPTTWWASLSAAVRQAVGSAGIDAGAVGAISVSGTGTTVVAASRTGEPLRSSLMWMDVRAADEARTIAESGSDVIKLSGGSASAEWFFSKTLWIARHEPEVFRRADILCECVDWLGHRLTGRWAANLSLAAVRAYYRASEGGWPVDLLERIGHTEVLAKVAPEVLPPGEVLGGLTAQSASDLGLREGTPVAVAAADAEVAAIGLGAVDPGQAVLITGSSHLLLAQTSRPVFGAGVFGSYDSGLLPGGYLLEGGQASTGSVTKWIKDVVSGASMGCSVDDADAYNMLIAGARAAGIGAGGVHMLDMWQGNRTPYVDAEAKGMFWGLTVGHGPGHLFRAALEGIAFGTENILRAFADIGHRPDRLIIAGGAARNELWLQIHADVARLPLDVSDDLDAVTLGNAMLAATAAGSFPDVQTAARTMKRGHYTLMPDASSADRYQELFADYQQSYLAMKDLMSRVARRDADKFVE